MTSSYVANDLCMCSMSICVEYVIMIKFVCGKYLSKTYVYVCVTGKISNKDCYYVCVMNK